MEMETSEGKFGMEDITAGTREVLSILSKRLIEH